MPPISPGQTIADVPALMAPLLSALGLSNMSADHPILQRLSELRIQDPERSSNQPSIHDFFEDFFSGSCY